MREVKKTKNDCSVFGDLADVSLVRKGENYALKVESPGIIPISSCEFNTSLDGLIKYHIKIDGTSSNAVLQLNTKE